MNTFDATTIIQLEEYVEEEEEGRGRERKGEEKGRKRGGGLSLCELA